MLRPILLLGLSFAALAQPIRVGDTAPELILERTIPESSAASALRGAPVVLEFWATWCGNCIAELPHWNALVAKFPAIRFVSITDENAAVVERFLAKQPIAGTVAIDRAGATFQAYGVQGRPQTVLIDRNGIVRGVMHPGQVSEAVLNDLAADRAVAPYGLAGRLRMMEPPIADPVFAVMLRPSSNPKPGALFSVDAGRLEGTNTFLRTLLAFAYSVGERLIEGPEIPLATRYDFCVLLPEGGTGDLDLLRGMLERAFRLKVRREAKPMDVVVMKSAGPAPDGPDRLSTLARVLEARFRQPVVNDTGRDTYRHFQLPEKEEDLAEAFRSRVGIELVRERRDVEKLVIDSIELPTYRLGVRR